MRGFFKEVFSKLGAEFSNQLAHLVTAVMKSGKANTYAISRQLGELNEKSFNTNEMALYRFLQNPSFQIDDRLWRRHSKLIFRELEVRGLVCKKEPIQINVDYTTIEDNFLILSASVMVNDKAITLYFTMRRYPKKAGRMSCKHMEKAFIKGLRHILSKKYSYLIVADRGFGNPRFAQLCEDNGFDYVIRVSSRLKIKIKDEEKKLKEEIKDSEFEAEVLSWKKQIGLRIVNKEGKRWYLVSNKRSIDASKHYGMRFKIEKSYQDLKSSGYEIEKSKIRKYDRFKRLFYLVVLAHGITSILGSIIKEDEGKNSIKKNSTGRLCQRLRLI